MHKPVVQRIEKTVKTVKTWTAERTVCLRGCFDCTDLQVFYDSTSDLNELVDVFSSYVTCCVDMLVQGQGGGGHFHVSNTGARSTHLKPMPHDGFNAAILSCD